MRSAIFILFTSLFPILGHSAELEGSNIKGFQFSYMQIEKNCFAQREGRESLSIQCKGKNLKPVSRSCGGFISGGLSNATLNCGGALWVLNQRCKIEMRGAERGEINCKL